jgi:hypothetical protein
MPPPVGLVTPCGQSTTIWKLAEIFGLADPLHTRVASEMPVFGFCTRMIRSCPPTADAATELRAAGGWTAPRWTRCCARPGTGCGASANAGRPDRA